MEFRKRFAALLGVLLLPLQLSANDWYRPAVQADWQIQLQGTPNTGYPVDLYILDLFDTSTSVIDDMHASGRHVICYFSAGTVEDWRQDSSQFRPEEMGRGLANWPGERWLDIRSDNVRRIMAERIALAARKGCDGVDPDNVDGYNNNTGFVLTGDDQLDYNRFLADLAHENGLAISLKNNVEQAHILVEHMDFAVNESCHQWNECQQLQAFIEAGKPVFHIDYLFAQDQGARESFCQQMASLEFNTQTLPVALDDSYRFRCNP